MDPDFDKALDVLVDENVKDCDGSCGSDIDGECRHGESAEDFADVVAEMKSDYAKENY